MPETCNFIKKDTPTQAFSCEFWEIFNNAHFEEHMRATASVKILCQINQEILRPSKLIKTVTKF